MSQQKSHTHTFEHKAMKTTFTLRLKHEDKKLAQNAAREATELIDEIENKLSRYIQGSDVWQINHMQAGQSLFLSELCYDCLCEGLKAYEQTGGLFDVTLGRLIEHRKNKQTSPAPELVGQLVVLPDRPAIQCQEAGREIDLGGIGKGFALDRAKKLITEWGIKSGILSAGASTHLAFGPQKWTLGLTGKKETREIMIQEQALSASGTVIQEEHIVAATELEAECQYPRVWVLHPSATWADVWSTTAMLLSMEELREMANQFAGLYVENPANGCVEQIEASF
ncbi:MAG: FAD:protein FMN transferase [Opitutales bacterium]